MRPKGENLLRECIRKIYWVLSFQFGIDLRLTFRSLLGLKRYVRDILHFCSGYRGRFELRPCLHDWYEEGGTTKSEYFWQDLLVARMIFEAKPVKHLDIGSRVDGFVAHVASFREIDVLDVRPIKTQIPGVTFKQADLMKPVKDMAGYCDSLSCLHALEHFGLGRYGDPIDPIGFKHGLVNMASLLREDGVFYLSVPIGIDRVEFNAHRVFDPRHIVELATGSSLQLIGLKVVRPSGKVETEIIDSEALNSLANLKILSGNFHVQENV